MKVFDDLRRRYDEAQSPARRLEKQTDADTRARLAAAVPYLAGVWRPSAEPPGVGPGARFRVATYNVHRWTGVRGGRAFVPERAISVLARLDADVIALQEVLLPFDDPALLERAAERLGLHVAFAATRIHRRGELGNALLTRWPFASVLTIDLSRGRLEQRSALAIELRTEHAPVPRVSVVATHLALVDRTRKHQVMSLLEHPQLHAPVVLLGDMNAWRRCPATRELDAAFVDEDHHNRAWPATFPAPRPVLALDRIYARGARIDALEAATVADARIASDHLPVVATVTL